MALSFKEKREIQKSLKADFFILPVAGGFKEKRTVQKRIKKALVKLTGTAWQKGKTLFDRLLAGEFYKLSPIAFFEKLVKIIEEIGERVTELHTPCIEYLKRHEAELF